MHADTVVEAAKWHVIERNMTIEIKPRLGTKCFFGSRSAGLNDLRFVRLENLLFEELKPHCKYLSREKFGVGESNCRHNRLGS